MATPTGALFNDPRAKPLSTSGQFQSGCYYCFFNTLTTTSALVYSDGFLTTPLSQPAPASVNPVAGTVAAGDGRFVPIYMDPTVIYRVQLYNAAGVLLEDTDPYIPPQSGLSFAQFDITPAEIAAGVIPVNKTYPPADVRRYGADPTGATECSAAFETAWAAYKTIYAPTGTYLVNPINPPSTQYQRTLYGDGSGTNRTLLIANGQDDVVQLSNSSVTQHTFVLRDLGIQGPGTQTTITFTAAVLAGATSATLATPWALSTTTWPVTFSDGETRRVTLTNGTLTAVWTGGLGNNCTSIATTGGSGLKIPINASFPIANLTVSDVTVNSMGGPGICDHNGCFDSQYLRVQVNNCLDNQFDILGGNTNTFIGCYAQGIPVAGKAGYRIHGGRPTMIGCNGINGAGALGLSQYGYVFSDIVGEDGRSSFCVPTMIGCNCEDATVAGVRNKNSGCIFIDTTILAPTANYPVTFTGAFGGGETSGTLSAPWPHLGGQYYVGFSNGDVRIVAVVNGATTASWPTGLSGAATSSAATNSVCLTVDSVNEPGWCNNINVLIQSKGSTLANGTGIHTRSNNNPFYFAGNQVGPSLSFFDDTGQTLYSFGAMGKAVTVAAGRQGMGFGDSVFENGIVATQYADTRATIPYSASMTPDATAGNIQEITANNAIAFTIKAPTGLINGQKFTLVIKNSSGGAMGAATFNAIYHNAGAFTNPGNGNNRSITYYYNNSVLYETGRTAADVAN
jgi:hypothetical protein